MKYFKINILALLAATLAFTACEKDEIPPVGDVASKLAGINATWKLSKVEQADEKFVGDVKTFDISEFFTGGGSVPTIKFDATAKTYTYTPGNAPNFLGAAGSWKFDDDQFPTNIKAKDAASGREATWMLGGPTRPVDTQLRLAIRRDGCAGDAAYFYLFTFVRQ